MKILIIEKERDLLYALERALKNKGYEVITAFDGVQGAEAVTTDALDAVIVGVEIPRVSADEIAERAKRNNNAPVLILVCRDKEDLRFKQKNNKLYDGLIALPFTPDDLITSINDAAKRDDKKQ